MTDSAPVADDRDKLTHSHIPEHLVAKGRNTSGNTATFTLVFAALS